MKTINKIKKEMVGYDGFIKGCSINEEDAFYFLEYLRGMELVSFILAPRFNDFGVYDVKDSEDGTYIGSVNINDITQNDLLDKIISVEKTILDKRCEVCYVKD